MDGFEEALSERDGTELESQALDIAGGCWNILKNETSQLSMHLQLPGTACCPVTELPLGYPKLKSLEK